MQGAVTHPAGGYPARCEAYVTPTSQRRTHRSDGYPVRGHPPHVGHRRWDFVSSRLILGVPPAPALAGERSAHV